MNHQTPNNPPSFKKRAALILAGIVIGFFIFGAGVVVGIGYEGHLNQWSKNIDMSDYISMTIIALLSVALWLSLSSQNKR
jgi:F0F1-type ATP synthase membrane subunit c/vacuolar-type H+-ATPase subunit K